jgi:hypothetical protein
VSDECVGGRGGVVTGWGRIGGRGKDRGIKWMRGGKRSSWDGEKWIVAQEKERT